MQQHTDLQPRARGKNRMRSLVITTNSAFDTLLLCEGETPISEWQMEPKVAAGLAAPGDLAEWDAHDIDGLSDYGRRLTVEDFGDVVAEYRHGLWWGHDARLAAERIEAHALPIQLATQAERVSALYNNDGQVWEARAAGQIEDVAVEPGQNMGDVLVMLNALAEWRDGYRTGDTVRYTLPDGSVITESGGAWDYGYPDCFCWQGAGHTAGCQRSRGG